MRWVQKAADAKQVEALSKALGLHPVVARILAARGHATPESVERFLSTRIADLPDPFLMKGMRLAVDRIARSLESAEKITVYGDYDVDGVTSTTLLVTFLRSVGAHVDFYVPHRLAEGYGLNPGAVERIAATGTQLIVTVDCGVTAVEEVDQAARAGVDVVVVDHHQTPTELPRAVAMLNPHQADCPFPAKELSAVGVVFHLLMALRRDLRERGRFDERTQPNLKAMLDLVALGTIADVVPLVGANRILVAHGLEQLRASRRVGLQALRTVCKLDDAPIGARDVGFKLGPRINAAGRLDDASTAVELLLCEDRIRAEQLADLLDRANTERQNLERRITSEALAQASRKPSSDRALVLAAEGWHPGVVGIVASRVKDAFHKPVIVLGFEGDTARGSCRSIEKFHMHQALERCSAHLLKYGGHHHAAGLSLERSRLPDFERALLAEAARQLQPDDLTPTMKIDAEVHARDATMALAESLQALGPFGAGNPEPVLSAEVAAIEATTLVNKHGGVDHLKFPLGGAEAIAFSMSDKKGLLRGHAKVAFELGIDRWRERVKASARVKAIDDRG